MSLAQVKVGLGLREKKGNLTIEKVIDLMGKIVMDIQHYINEINREFVKGNSTEHTFRGTLKNLLGVFMWEYRCY